MEDFVNKKIKNLLRIHWPIHGETSRILENSLTASLILKVLLQRQLVNGFSWYFYPAKKTKKDAGDGT